MKQSNPLHFLFKESLSLFPNQVFVSLGSKSLNYKKLDRKISKLYELILENVTNECVFGISIAWRIE